MNKRQFNYKWALWVIVIVVLLRVLFFCITFFTFKSYSPVKDNQVLLRQLLNFWVWIFPLLYIGEGIVYFLLRKRKLNRSYVNIHLRCLLVENIFLPFFFGVLGVLVARFLSKEQLQNNFALFGNLRTVIIWAVFIIGHIFFVLAIVKNFSSENEAPKTDEPDGFLNEFADQS